VAAALAAASLSGCAGPQYTYVRDDDGATYFKVPSSWRQIDQRVLEQKLFGEDESATVQALKKLTWIVAYDAQAQPSADHLLIGPADADDKPFALAKVRKLTEAEMNQVSLNTLRNSINLPVAISETERQKMETDEENPFKGFELLDDKVLPVQDGVRGVRSVFNFRLAGGPVQTFDQTAFLSADGTQVSTLLIRCSATCYREKAAEIDMIAQSFKVKRLLNQ